MRSVEMTPPKRHRIAEMRHMGDLGKIASPKIPRTAHPIFQNFGDARYDYWLSN
jgi:hypothetical protein